MNRRRVLKMLAASSLSNPASATGVEDQILELDCTDLLARMRDGSVRAEQVCARFLAQYERHRALNPITWIDPSSVLARARQVDRARAQGARLPALAGLPILVKDNIDTVGHPTSAGTAALKQNFPLRDAPVVERLVRHGAIVLGKANMHELALGPTSSNPTFGFVRNPYQPDLVPGGSSGGCAAAIAARIVPAALGTDTGGSVRIPAAFCGIVGFRPSTYPRKLYSQQGVVPVVCDLDTIGPMGRCVADVALLHRSIVDRRPAPLRSVEELRIGVPKRAYWDDLDPEVERVARAALARLRDRGATLVEIDLREIKDAASELSSTLSSVAIMDLENFLRKQVPSVSLRDLTQRIASRDVRAIVEKLHSAAKHSGTGTSPELLNARGVKREAICVAYRAAFRLHDIQAVVFPTEVLLPPPIRSTGDDPNQTIEFNGRQESLLTLFRNTAPAAALGAPALSLPAGLTRDGLPVGLELDGLPADDDRLLALGTAVEAAIGRVPAPLHTLSPGG